MADLHRKTKQSNFAIILEAKASVLNQTVPLHRFLWSSLVCRSDKVVD